jgi:hypothetical protein
MLGSRVGSCVGGCHADAAHNNQAGSENGKKFAKSKFQGKSPQGINSGYWYYDPKGTGLAFNDQ